MSKPLTGIEASDAGDIVKPSGEPRRISGVLGPLPPRAIILPSEIQAREFDAKLLLACILAARGVPVIVGARHEIHASIHTLPRSIYVAKDIRISSLRMFEILDRLGHDIVAWDEEGLLTFGPELYYARRVSETAVGHVREFFAWGAENQTLIEGAPGYSGAPVHLTGNPRIDLCRRELRSFHASEVARLNQRYGKFILINSNFGGVNHKVPSQAVAPGQSDPKQRFAPSAEMDAALRHRLQMFAIFRDLLQPLGEAFSDHQIIVRPHPAEDHEAWRAAAKGQGNVQVVHEASVLPWLLAAGVTLHNGCSTGLEAFLLDRPAISYQPEGVEPRAPALSDRLSQCAVSWDDLAAMIGKGIDTGAPLPQSTDQWALVETILAATSGPLASERIADHLCDLHQRCANDPMPAPATVLSGAMRARWRMVQKRVSGFIPDHKAGKAHNLHRFPGVSVAEVNAGIASFAKALGRFDGVRAREVRNQIFAIEQC